VHHGNEEATHMKEVLNLDNNIPCMYMSGGNGKEKLG
jgi:hypothetical protein